MSVFNLAAVDWSNPALFYFWSEELAALADAAIKHGDQSLPVHSQVLATQSQVLRQLFLSLREEASSNAPTTQGAPIVLQVPFGNFSLQEVACLLRLLYHAADATPANLAAMGQHAGGVIRLAQMLDVKGPLLPAAEQFLLSQVASAEGALKWAEMAGTCQMRAVCAQAIRTLAVDLIAGPDGPSGAFVMAQRLGGLGGEACQAVLAAVGATCRQLGWSAPPTLAAPSAAQLARWPEAPPAGGAFTWHVFNFVRSPPGEHLASPSFPAVGHSWHIKVIRYGNRHTGHLGMFLACEDAGAASTAVVFSLEVVNQVTGGVVSERAMHQYTPADEPRGFPHLAVLADLWGTPGYVVDGTIVVRAWVSLAR